MKTIIYTDRAHDIVDFEVNFPRKMDNVYPAALIGATMALLNAKSTKEERGALLVQLMVNAGRGSFDFISFGNYDWISSKTDTSIMVRASRKRH
jgi:hypothetical protein